MNKKGTKMTSAKKLSVTNLLIYLVFFVADVIFVGMVKDDVASFVGGLIGGGELEIGAAIAAVTKVLAMLFLIISGVVTVVNVILKILQISFDKWGFSVASVVIDSLVVLWTGIVTVSYLSGSSSVIGAMCFLLLALAILGLIFECLCINKRGEK